LYYDPDLGSYYQYDDQLKTYTLHSRVDLPECQMRRKQPEREVEIILIDEDELSGQFLMDGWMGILVGLTLRVFARLQHRGAFRDGQI
jgi:hypothetical protein